MATVPVNLGYGQVLIYGAGLATGTMGFTFEQAKYKFGNIYQIYEGGEAYFNVGDSVVFNVDEIEARIQYQNYYYTLINQSRLAISENEFLP
jgi:hypothetical protein